MATIQDNPLYQLEEVLKAGFLLKIKERLIDRIVKEQVEVFEKALRGKVKTEVSKLTVETVERVLDMAKQCNDLNVVMYFKEDVPEPHRTAGQVIPVRGTRK